MSSSDRPVASRPRPPRGNRSNRMDPHCITRSLPSLQSKATHFSTTLWITGGKVADNLWITQSPVTDFSIRCITAGPVHSRPRVLNTVDECGQLCAKFQRLNVDGCGNVENLPDFPVSRRLPACESRSMCIILCTNGPSVHTGLGPLWVAHFSTFPHA